MRWAPNPNIPYFDGHFPNQPMLPAVGVMDANLVILEKLLNRPIRLQKLIAAKFALPIQPEMKMLIRLKRKPGSTDQIWLCDWLEDTADLPAKTLAHMTLLVAFS